MNKWLIYQQLKLATPSFSGLWLSIFTISNFVIDSITYAIYFSQLKHVHSIKQATQTSVLPRSFKTCFKCLYNGDSSLG